MQSFPEVDRAGWFAMGEAVEKINPAQVALLERAHLAMAPRPQK
jgi:predicted NUDIX family NTP pyrophosphohydrolase